MAAFYLVSGDDMGQTMACMRMSFSVGGLGTMAWKEEVRASELLRVVESRHQKMTDASTIDGCILGATSKFNYAMIKGEEDIIYLDIF